MSATPTPRRDPNERAADRELEKAKKKFWRWIRNLAIVGLLILAGIIYTLKFHSVTKHDAAVASSAAACRAVHQSLQVLQKYIIHQERKSIENVEAGITSATTSLPELKAFYQPTLEEIKEIRCTR